MNRIDYYDFRKNALEEGEEQFEAERINSKIGRNSAANSKSFAFLNKNGISKVGNADSEMNYPKMREGKYFESNKRHKFVNLIKLISESNSNSPAGSYRMMLPQSYMSKIQ